MISSKHKEAIEDAISSFRNILAPFAGKTILVTGATGLIGFNTVAFLLLLGERLEQSVKVVVLVRNIESATRRFDNLPQDNLVYLQGDVCKVPAIDFPVDFIVHAAAQTDSDSMINNPVSVINTALAGAKNMLDLAVAYCAKIVYVSSMEVYGAHYDDSLIDEHSYGFIDQLNVRSSYPESKRMAEALCVAYAKQFDVHACIARLSQSFGYGIPANDVRIFSYLARCVKEGKDVELSTDGLSTRMYVSSVDAAAALLILLLKGEKAEAYNIANEETYCSIYEMAQMVVREYAGNTISVKTQAGNSADKYPPSHHLRLDCSKIKALGWKPLAAMGDMFDAVFESA